MKILIDTHCWLWWLANPDHLNDYARQLIADSQNTILLSAASAWEIMIKVAVDKLSLPEPPVRYIPSRLAAQGMTSLAIEQVHVLQVASLPLHHRDPFDRILIAQSQVEKLQLLTADRQLAVYDTQMLWAGHGTVP